MISAATKSVPKTSFPPLTMQAVQNISYQIHHVSSPVFDSSESTLADLIGNSPVLFVVDDYVWSQYGGEITAYAEQNLWCVGVHCISGSEKNKNLETVSFLCQAADAAKLPRNGLIVGVGGGVVLDVAGFAAAIYRRGISYVRVPTSLIGLVDVGMGIKHGVNYCGKKNLLGSFFPPLACVNDKRFLRSLPHRHMAAGIAEIIKMALVADPELFTLVERYGVPLVESRFQSLPAVADEVLFRAETAMLDELAANLFESELQRFSDFGHTFGPKLEIESDHSLVHGEAVALDMLVSVAIGIQQGVCDAALLARMLAVYRSVGLPTENRMLEPALLMDAASEARAHRAGALNLVIPRSIGSAVFIQNVSLAQIEGALRVIGDFN
jgi:2-epi-5-epi-valiolone synthase